MVSLRKVSIYADLKPKVKGLRLFSTRLSSTNFMGEYASVFKGKGIEFADFRAYGPEDDASRIDWLASMKSNEMLVREYLEERNLNAFFLLDASNTMLFGSHEKLKHEYAVELVSSVAHEAMVKGDAIGLGMFSDKVTRFIPPRVGEAQYHSMLRSLANPNLYGGRCDCGHALSKIVQLLEPGTILFVVSDFIGFEKGWKRFYRICSRKFQTVSFIIRDPRDNYLPEGVNEVVLEDAITGEQILVDVAKIRGAFENEVKRELDELKSFFLSNNSDFIMLDTSRAFTKPVIEFFSNRRRLS